MIGLGALMPSQHARAETSTKTPRIGGLSGPARFGLSEFKQRLRELGYVAGQNVLMDARSPKNDEIGEYSVLAAQLVAADADVILAANPLSLGAVSAATKGIPVVGVDLE